MNRRMIPAAALALAMVAAPALAYGADSDVQNLVAGDALHNEATALLNQGKLAESSKKYGEAFAKSHNPASLYAQGYVETELKHWKVAHNLFRAYLALPANVKITADWRKKAENQVSVCEKNLCRIDVRAETFQIDGRPESGVVIEEPGAHAVTMSEHGAEKTKTVKCAAGELVTIAYDEKGTGPVGPVGPVTPPVEREHGSWVLPAVLAGVGVVGLGVGFGLGAASSSKADETIALFEAGACKPRGTAACTAATDSESSGSSLATGSVVGYVVGGAFIGAAIVSALVLKPWEVRERKISFVPGIGGAALVGKF